MKVHSSEVVHGDHRDVGNSFFVAYCSESSVLPASENQTVIEVMSTVGLGDINMSLANERGI